MLGCTSVTDGGSYTRALKVKDLKVKKKSTKGRNLGLVPQVSAKK